MILKLKSSGSRKEPKLKVNPKPERVMHENPISQALDQVPYSSIDQSRLQFLSLISIPKLVLFRDTAHGPKVQNHKMYSSHSLTTK